MDDHAADARRFWETTGARDWAGLAALSFFGFDDAGRISRIQEWWPEPYEPPVDRAHLTERI